MHGVQLIKELKFSNNVVTFKDSRQYTVKPVLTLQKLHTPTKCTDRFLRIFTINSDYLST
jgi:hypothetical protein